jgi:hypothetical protein
MVILVWALHADNESSELSSAYWKEDLRGHNANPHTLDII